jgi:hypothetical protein
VKIKIFILSCSLALFSSQIFPAWFSNQTQYLSEKWIQGETDKALDVLLFKNRYSDVIQNLNHFIYEQKNENAWNWLVEKANYGYVPLIHFLVKYKYNLFVKKVANITQVEQALIFAIASLILTQIEIDWSGYQRNEKLVAYGICTLSNLKTTYLNYFSGILSEYQYKFENCLEQALKRITQIFINIKENNIYINPAWICTTSLYKEEIIFSNPDDTNCVMALGGLTLAKILETKIARQSDVIYTFNQNNKSWKDLLSFK